ncbi:MAG: sigma-54-dependent Fis family transcriptional regulator [Thermoanaerobaculia bacterium]|jgi:transcriptional regulator with GAF, ATPase, and Fis domain|nr:sigma-54-dependent Fis family transcriptional regulator [Thermoanaerobaculia bacterium]MBP9822886.1 sigma-54-dependent Fis family transcriptional regulator [Thermoanaerobaculia bacterium]
MSRSARIDPSRRSERLFSPAALEIRELSVRRSGPERAIEIVGRSPRLEETLKKVAKVARYDDPVLVYGESGVGKESLAQAIHLLGNRSSHPFVSVNCPQFQEGNLTVSELFGHRKGSFTGAVSDHRGCFETADGGVVFLDEIGDLAMNAQVMLLRAIGTGEFRPLGSEVARKTSVRIVSATNRSLNEMVSSERFRNDLLFRLRYFMIEPPALRERGDDWLLLIEWALDRLACRYGTARQFSDESLRLMEGYRWPGNVRELISVVATGYALAEASRIEPLDFVDRLEHQMSAREDHVAAIHLRLSRGNADFWALVHAPFLDRDLSRSDIRQLLTMGLNDSGGSYRRLLELWAIPATDYKRFMGFLHHHRLQPRPTGEPKP